MKFRLLIFLFLAAAPIARGNIGEDEKQIEARYGKAGKIVTDRGKYRQIGYTSGGFMILVDFVDGISRREGFASPDTSILAKSDVEQILATNAGPDLKWEELPDKEGAHYWNRSDWKVIAIFPSEGKFLFVQEPGFVQPRP